MLRDGQRHLVGGFEELGVTGFGTGMCQDNLFQPRIPHALGIPVPAFAGVQKQARLRLVAIAVVGEMNDPLVAQFQQVPRGNPA